MPRKQRVTREEFVLDLLLSAIGTGRAIRLMAESTDLEAATNLAFRQGAIARMQGDLHKLLVGSLIAVAYPPKAKTAEAVERAFEAALEVYSDDDTADGAVDVALVGLGVIARSGRDELVVAQGLASGSSMRTREIVWRIGNEVETTAEQVLTVASGGKLTVRDDGESVYLVPVN